MHITIIMKYETHMLPYITGETGFIQVYDKKRLVDGVIARPTLIKKNQPHLTLKKGRPQGGSILFLSTTRLFSNQQM